MRPSTEKNPLTDLLREFFEQHCGIIVNRHGIEICYHGNGPGVSISLVALLHQSTDSTGEIVVELSSEHEEMTDFINAYQIHSTPDIEHIGIQAIWNLYYHGTGRIVCDMYDRARIYFKMIGTEIHAWELDNETEQCAVPTPLTTIEEYIAFSKLRLH